LERGRGAIRLLTERESKRGERELPTTRFKLERAQEIKLDDYQWTELKQAAAGTPVASPLPLLDPHQQLAQFHQLQSQEAQLDREGVHRTRKVVLGVHDFPGDVREERESELSDWRVVDLSGDGLQCDLPAFGTLSYPPSHPSALTRPPSQAPSSSSASSLLPIELPPSSSSQRIGKEGSRRSKSLGYR
jgi:hypothetical protein